jgi:hypothetical protein
MLCIISFSPDIPMEAERINAISKQLHDVAARTAALRRYL